VLLRGVMTFMFFGVDAYVSLTLEEYRGLSAIVAGIVLTAATVSWTAGSWIQARNAERWPTARFVQAGFLVAVIGLATFSLILVPDVPVAWAVPTFAVAGLGMGLGYAPLSLIVLREAPSGTQGTASSALSLSDTLGTAMGTGVSGAIIAASLRATGGSQTGLATAFGVAIAVGIGGFFLTRRLRRTVRVARPAAIATSASPTLD
jgi:MFS family permease